MQGDASCPNVDGYDGDIGRGLSLLGGYRLAARLRVAKWDDAKPGRTW